MDSTRAVNAKRGRPQLYPVILAGGSGTRFWPLSRRQLPKQLLPLSGRAPLLVETIARLKGIATAEQVLVVCGSLHSTEIKRLLPALPAGNLLVEPAPRNTAAAIGWAAIKLQQLDPEATLAVLPSDHHIQDLKTFRSLLRDAAALAQDGTLVTLGITPSEPHTGFGYLKMGPPLPESRGVRGACGVAGFVEKPSLAVARRYLKSGRYLWNAGIFVWRADAILDQIRRQLPALARVLAKIAASADTPAEAAAVARWFPRAPSVSIDYGVMENAERVAVLPAKIGWSDLGSFDALPQVRPLDATGNLSQGQTILIDCEGCVVLAKGRPLAVVGVKDLVVVDAGDALLVVPRARVQEVRKVVAELTRRRLNHLL